MPGGTCEQCKRKGIRLLAVNLKEVRDDGCDMHVCWTCMLKLQVVEYWDQGAHHVI